MIIALSVLILVPLLGLLLAEAAGSLRAERRAALVPTVTHVHPLLIDPFQAEEA